MSERQALARARQMAQKVECVSYRDRRLVLVLGRAQRPHGYGPPGTIAYRVLTLARVPVLMPFAWILGLALLVVLVWIAARSTGGFSVRSAEDSAEQILKRRYARGEIDREEYDRRLSDIRR